MKSLLTKLVIIFALSSCGGDKKQEPKQDFDAISFMQEITKKLTVKDSNISINK